MDRRRFLRTVSASLLAAPLAVEAQQAGKVYRIGHVFTGDLGSPWSAFVQALSGLGWVDGRNIVFEYRQLVLPPSGSLADSKSIQQVAEEFVRIKVDVIVVAAAGWALFIQKMTGTIPIVVLNGGELVASGIVSSLARPGGYITGMQTFSPELQGKRLQILKEIIPTLSRVAVLRRGTWPAGVVAAYRQPTDDAARKLGLRLRYVLFRNPDELPGVFAGMVSERDAAIILWTDPAIVQHARQIVDLAVRHRLPTAGEGVNWAEAGILIAYGPKREALWRQGATHVDRILKGASAGELPIGQPTTFELAINLKTAKAIGLTIAASLLVRADQVFE
jgi:putative tryptophan/tyrosine transport system substrate-binding protein